MQEYEQDPMAKDSDDAQKIRQAEQRATRKRKVKTSASFTQSFSSTISKAPSFQFWNASFQNGYSPPIPTKTKFGYNANNPLNNPFNNPFRFTRTPKSTDTCMGCGEQGDWRKDCPKVQQHNKTERDHPPPPQELLILCHCLQILHAKSVSFCTWGTSICISIKIR